MRDRTEGAVERVFFHAWHVRDAALRKFVQQAAHILAPDHLLAAFHAALARYAEGAECAIYVHRRDGSYERAAGTAGEPLLDADHPVAVALRAEPAPTLLEPGTGAGDMELALPMVHRGELDGLVLLGRRAGGHAYRPDEIDALAFAAHQVGLDLHALEVDRLRRELAEVSAQARTYRSLIEGATATGE